MSKQKVIGGIILSEENYLSARKAYWQAVANHQSQFMWKGQVWTTRYMKYILECMEMESIIKLCISKSDPDNFKNRNMVRIKILKDTPFDKAGTVMDIKQFRLKYSHVCSKDTTDEELIIYLQEAHRSSNFKGKTAEFFAVDDVIPVPLDFIYNGILYSKQIDGMYHLFIPGSVILAESSVGVMGPSDAEELFLKEAKHRRLIWYCTDVVKRKLS